MTVPTALTLGRSGELFVMSEFLLRGYNVATTEVDTGHDLIALQDGAEKQWPIQVKTTSKDKVKGSDYVARYGIQLELLYAEHDPEVTYFFVTRFSDGWADPIIIPRKTLCEWHRSGALGNQNASRAKIELRFRHRSGRVRCYNQDLTAYINNWHDWPQTPMRDKRLDWSLNLPADQ